MPIDHDDRDEHGDQFTERVAHTLRTPERFDDDFERSLVAAIKAERPLDRSIAARHRRWSAGWWGSPSFQMSPLAGLAAAACLATISILGTLVASHPGT